MAYNELYSLTFTVPYTDDLASLSVTFVNKISEIMYDNPTAYSCILMYDKSTYKCKINFCTDTTYNTFSVEDITETLLKGVLHTDVSKLNKKTITYCQPDLSLILRVFYPYINKMVAFTHLHWQFLERADLLQDAYLVICKLYKKNYYINRYLVENSYKNYIWQQLRSNKNRPDVISFEQLASDCDNLELLEQVPDALVQEQDEMRLHHIAMTQLLNKLKPLIVYKIGDRGFEQLLKEYAGKRTTDWSRRATQDLRAYLASLGITSAWFKRQL